MAAELTVREVRVAVKGFRMRSLVLVTTLLDAKLYGKDEIAAAFRCRWHAETHVAQLKAGIKMGQLKCKSGDGVKRELLTCFIAYNLTRTTIRDAAERQGLAIRRISFLDALRWLANAREGDELIVLAVIPLRPDRHEPRVKKYLKYRYRPMTRPRHILKKRPYLYADKVK